MTDAEITEASLRDQEELERLRVENATLKEQLAAIRGAIDTLAAGVEPTPDAQFYVFGPNGERTVVGWNWAQHPYSIVQRRMNDMRDFGTRAVQAYNDVEAYKDLIARIQRAVDMQVSGPEKLPALISRFIWENREGQDHGPGRTWREYCDVLKDDLKNAEDTISLITEYNLLVRPSLTGRWRAGQWRGVTGHLMGQAYCSDGTEWEADTLEQAVRLCVDGLKNGRKNPDWTKLQDGHADE